MGHGALLLCYDLGKGAGKKNSSVFVYVQGFY
jgi:hypothetical protein